MSSGTLTELSAKGAQDAYLTLRPSMTFFKGAYQRYTNFAVTQLEQCFNNGPNYGKKLCAPIQRNGDLLAETYIVFQLDELKAEIIPDNPQIDPNTQEGLEALYAPEDAAEGGVLDQGFPKGPVIHPGNTNGLPPVGVHYTNAVGHALIERVSVHIGGHEFDCHTGDYLEIWESLSAKSNKELGSLIGSANDIDTLFDYAANRQVLYVPLQFWFCRSWQQALPLIALQYHQVSIEMQLRAQDDVVQIVNAPNNTLQTGEAAETFTVDYSGGAMEDTFLLCNYVFLDTFERRLFAQKYHTYVFDQVQFTGDEGKPATRNTHNVPLRFNHPVQELIWVIQTHEAIENKDWFDYSIKVQDPIAPDGILTSIDPLVTAKLQFNGHERFPERPANYFRQVQPLEHHSRIPSRFIYTYSFGKDPEHPTQPNGSVNMSRIDNIVLVLETHPSMQDGTIRVYARSKNVMRVISGMAGIRYSN